MRRQGTRLGIALALALVLPLTALAGGWAVVTLDTSPVGVQAGKAFEVGFTVLQHGKTPVEGLQPKLNFSMVAAGRPAGLAKGETLSFDARPEGKIGHYVASVTLPTNGTWNWEVDAFGPPAPMSALTVGAPAKAQTGVQQAQPAAETQALAPAAQPQTSPFPPAAWILAGAIGLALVATALVLRRPRRSTARV